MNLIFEQIRVGGDRNFGYLLGDRAAKQAVLFDPSYSPEIVVQRAFDQGLTVTHIINTHGDHDHINGNAKAAELTRAPIAAHPDGRGFPDVMLKDGSELNVGSLVLQFIYTPGHLDDHLVVYEKTHALLFSGDLIFVGKVGGTPTEEDARVEWESIQRVLQIIPDHATVWPGHDYGVRPVSTIALEKASNPFLRCENVEAFLRLKREWPEYKKSLGLK
ncbi:MAG: MBL fold metallo-hydrolase [Planctomycetota bacterium]